METKKAFKRENIEPGHVIQLRNGELRMIMPIGKSGVRIAVGPAGNWNYVTNWDENLYARSLEFAMGYPSAKASAIAREYDIVAVYGFVMGSDNYAYAGDLCPKYRNRLWTRVEAMKMTVSEIAEALGYPVEIVEG